MSHIFDALQRSQADRAGTDISELPGPTELLERAERQAAARWASDPVSELEEDPGAEDLEFSSRLQGPLVADAETAAGITEEMRGLAAPRVLEQFPHLDSSLSPQKRLGSITDSEGAAAEAFRLLSVRLRDIRRGRTLKKVLVTSTIPAEGKSLVAANLACALSVGRRQTVLLVDGDLRRPSLCDKLGIAPASGLAEWLRGEKTITESICFLDRTACWLLPAGRATGNALELLQSGKLPGLMEQLTAWFDWVIVDSPPVMPLADTSVWARLADGILLVARPGFTRKGSLQRGLDALDPQKVIGTVLNSSKTMSGNDYYYYKDRPSDSAAAEAGNS